MDPDDLDDELFGGGQGFYDDEMFTSNTAAPKSGNVSYFDGIAVEDDLAGMGPQGAAMISDIYGDDEFDFQSDGEDGFADTALADILFELLDGGGLELDEDWRCPLTKTAAWRQHRSHAAFPYKEEFPLCKGKANGFYELSALYQHAEKRGVHCAFHKRLCDYIRKVYPNEITHINAVDKKKTINSVPVSKSNELDFGKVLTTLGPKDKNTKILWPPLILLTQLHNEEHCESKTKLMKKFERFHVSRAAPLYGNDSNNVPVFIGSAMLSFPDSYEGFAYASQLVYLVTKRPAELERALDHTLSSRVKARFAMEADLRGLRTSSSYKKILQGIKVTTYKHAVWDPYTREVQGLAPRMVKKPELLPSELVGHISSLADYEDDDDDFYF